MPDDCIPKIAKLTDFGGTKRKNNVHQGNIWYGREDHIISLARHMWLWLVRYIGRLTRETANLTNFEYFELIPTYAHHQSGWNVMCKSEPGVLSVGKFHLDWCIMWPMRCQNSRF